MNSSARVPLSLRAYARHRGTSVEAVRRAIKRRRLVGSIVIGADGKPKIADPILADAEWARNTDLTKAPTYVKEREGLRAGDTPVTPESDDPTGEPAPELSPTMSLTDATKADKYWSAMRKKLEYEQMAGELVNAKGAAEAAARLFILSRTKLLGIPGRVRAALPHLTQADVGLIDRLIREALEELANTSEGVAA